MPSTNAATSSRLVMPDRIGNSISVLSRATTPRLVMPRRQPKPSRSKNPMGVIRAGRGITLRDVNVDRDGVAGADILRLAHAGLDHEQVGLVLLGREQGRGPLGIAELQAHANRAPAARGRA